MTGRVPGTAAPFPGGPGSQRPAGFRLMIVSAVLGGCAVIAGAVAIAASANGNISPPALPGAGSPAGHSQHPAGVPSVPGEPSGLPSMPDLPTSVPSVPDMPTGVPSVPGMPTGVPSMPGMPGSLPNGGHG